MSLVNACVSVLRVLCLLGLALPARAETVSLTLANGVEAQAEYRTGRPGQPMILLLHGFLQTREFPTIHRLIDGLAGAGHGVLAPTLSLGIDRRRQSLACEAIHAHTLADDLAEIRDWMAWLRQRGHTRVVLLGHSTGSAQLLAWLDSAARPSASKFIGISLVEARLDRPDERPAMIADLKRRLARGDKHPLRRQLSYCRQYFGSPASLLSYLDWPPERLLATMRRVDTPQSYIMGSADDRLGPDWLARMKATGRRIEVIDGANHFMDGEHEFELIDRVLAELARP